MAEFQKKWGVGRGLSWGRSGGFGQPRIAQTRLNLARGGTSREYKAEAMTPIGVIHDHTDHPERGWNPPPGAGVFRSEALRGKTADYAEHADSLVSRFYVWGNRD